MPLSPLLGKGLLSRLPPTDPRQAVRGAVCLQACLLAARPWPGLAAWARSMREEQARQKGRILSSVRLLATPWAWYARGGTYCRCTRSTTIRVYCHDQSTGSVGRGGN